MNVVNASKYAFPRSDASQMAPAPAGQKKVPAFDDGDSQNKSGNVLLSHTFTRVVPSAQEGLTAEFGMGSGVTPPL